MVASLTLGRRGGGAFEYAIAGLGLAFLAVASYLTLQQSVTSTGKSAQDVAGTAATALDRITPGELADMRDRAGSAFAVEPLDATKIFALSRITAVDGNAEAADRLRLQAGEMMPRNAKVQAEALTILLTRRDFDQAMVRLDGLIRSRPAEARNFFALAADIAADPDGSKALARTLASTPPWRGQFLAYLLTSQQPEIATELMEELREIGTQIPDSEIAAVINYYLKISAMDQGYAVWLSSLSEDEMSDVLLIYDGGFRHPIRNLRFDWTLRPASGLTYRLFPRNTASSDQTLQLDFEDFTGSISHLSQILRLAPGRYRISGETRTDVFTSPTSLVFRIYCLADGRSSILDETAPLPQSKQWISFDKVLTVPPEKCDNQLLQLESKTKLLTTQLTNGMVAIDSLSIETLAILAQ